MTLRRYLRLLLVLLVPLLLTGFLLSATVLPFDKYAYISCAPAFGIENCRQVGDPDTPFHKSVRAEHPAWFDIKIDGYGENRSLTNFVEGSSRLITGTRILDASPFSNAPPGAAAYMRSLAGTPAAFQLGIDSPRRSSFIGRDAALLYCNSLDIREAPRVYSADCYGDGWAGPVKFEASGEGGQLLKRLNQAINEEAAKRENELFWYRISIYPLPLYVYLIFSALCFLAVKAYRFVKAG